MKLYEVKVTTMDHGWRNAYEHIAYTVTEAKANEIAKAWADECETHATWWMGYAQNAEGHPDVVVVELGDIVE